MDRALRLERDRSRIFNYGKYGYILFYLCLLVYLCCETEQHEIRWADSQALVVKDWRR